MSSTTKSSRWTTAVTSSLRIRLSRIYRHWSWLIQVCWTVARVANVELNLFSHLENALGLCHVLSRPCPKPQPQMWDLGPELRDKWEINRSEIQLIRKLGRGNFGEVFYGKWRNNIDVAVKTLREGTMSTQAFLQEAAIMKKFRHNRLVALYAVCSKEERESRESFHCNRKLNHQLIHSYLHRPRVHGEGQFTRFPPRGRRTTSAIRRPDLHCITNCFGNGVLGNKTINTSRSCGEKCSHWRKQHRQDMRWDNRSGEVLCWFWLIFFLRFWAGSCNSRRWILSQARITFSSEMDGTRSHRVWQVLNKIWRVVSARCLLSLNERLSRYWDEFEIFLWMITISFTINI